MPQLRSMLLSTLPNCHTTSPTQRSASCCHLLTAAAAAAAGWGSRLTSISAPSVSSWGGQQALIFISPVLLVIVQFITLYKLLLLPHPRPQVTVYSGGTSMGGSSRIGTGVGRSCSDGSMCSAQSANSKLSCGSTRDSSGHGNNGHPVLAKIVLAVFTTAEVICVVLQVSGAGVYADRASEMYGRLLLLAGLGMQLVFYTGFIGLVAVVQFHKYFGFRGDKSFRYVFVCLLSTAALMHLRLLVRIAEFAQGHRGDVAQHEAYLYVFDFWPILSCYLLYMCLHYGWWLGPTAPALLARQTQATKALELPTKQQQPPSPGRPQQADDFLHIHCS
jgi:hypothetical protein